MTSSYVSFLKKNGITSPQGYRNYNNEVDDLPTSFNGESFKEGLGETSPPSPFGEGDPPNSEGRDGGHKGFTRTPYRIIQENYKQNVKIFDLTDRETTGKHANKIALSVYESKRNEIESYLQENENYLQYLQGETFCWQYSTDFNNKIIDEYNTELLRWATKSFNTYREQTSNCCNFILMRHKQDHSKRCFIPLMNRYSKGYQNKVKKRMNWIIHYYRNSNAVSVVCTIDPKKYGNDKYLMLSEIKKEENRFLTDLKYYFKKRGLPFPKYISTIECQKGRAENNFIAKGNPHLHIVFLNCKRLLDWRKIRDLWGLGHVWINQTLKGDKIRYPINYITKYITKTFTETNEENCLTQALCWLFNIRSFSATRGLIRPLNNIDGNWESLLFISIKKTINSIQVLERIEILFFPVCLVDPPTNILLKKEVYE